MSIRIFPKRIGTAKQWRARKRREWREVLKALNTFSGGCAYTPVFDDFAVLSSPSESLLGGSLLMTSKDLARIEQTLTDEVLDNAYIRCAWRVASQHAEKTDWRVVRQNAAAVMRDILMTAIRRAISVEEARTCAPMSDILTPEEFASCLDALERDVRLTNHREPKDVLQAHDAALRAALDAEEARTCVTCGRWVPDTSDPTFGVTLAPAQEPEW